MASLYGATRIISSVGQNAQLTTGKSLVQVQYDPLYFSEGI